MDCRGDGNCFYRAYCASLLEKLCAGVHDGCAATAAAAVQEVRRLQRLVADSQAPLIKGGVAEYILADFEDAFKDLLSQLAPAGPTPAITQAELAAAMSDAHTDILLITYLRLHVTAALRADPDSYLPYIVAEGKGASVDEFCMKEVNAIHHEADMVQIGALASYTGVGITIEYLDRSPGALNNHTFPGGRGASPATPALCLLYRPGHFDILMK